jgi:hypothetical protein
MEMEMDLKHNTHYNDHPVTVTAGFDPVLRRFWAIVEPDFDDHPDADEESGMIYSNLDDNDIPEESVKVSPDYFRGKFKSMGIEVPAEFFDKVAAVNN